MKTVRELIVNAALFSGFSDADGAEADALDTELARLREENATLNAFIDFTAKNYAGLRNDALEEAAVKADQEACGACRAYGEFGNAIRALKTPVAGDGGAER